MNETYDFLNKNNYECLWNVYAKKALDDFDFISAEKAFLKMDNYKGLQFIKRLSLLDDKEKQKGEIQAFYKKYDEAEEVFKKAERKDLAI